MQLPPSIELRSIVKHYLVINSDHREQMHYRFFSDSNPGMVFNFNSPLIQCNHTNKIEQKQPRSFIYGQVTHYNDITLTGKLSMLVVVLQPYAIHALLGIAAYEINNAVVKLSDVFKQQALDLEEQLSNTGSISQSISLIERFLVKKLVSAHPASRLLKAAVDTIYKNRGQISIEELTRCLPVTERQIERLFNYHVGTSPKRFADTVRFQFFLKALQNSSPAKSLYKVIYEYGFYDQAHLNRYFKKSTGITPMQYKAGYNPAIINFMPMSR